MTIAEAAATVLREAEGPMHVRKIHAQITNRMLFEFKAKDPVTVLSTVLRKTTKRARLCDNEREACWKRSQRDELAY